METNASGTPQNQREVDKLVRDVHSWWGKTFLQMKTTRVKTWKGALFLAFFAGMVAALGWSASLDLHTGSKAAGETSTLALSASSTSVMVNGTFTVEVLLDTDNSNVVAAKANVSYNPQYFELQSWSTDGNAFASGNSCTYNAKPCEIVTTNPAQGTISVTLAKPTPGVNTASGRVAVLTFRALQAVTPGAPNITIAYSQQGGYSDSDVILDDGQGTDILSGVSNSAITVSATQCTSFTYSAWGACQPNNTQTRTVVSSSPAGCAGGNPVLSQSCTYQGGPVACTDFTYSEWSSCQPNNTQSRSVATSLPSGCSGGNPVLSQSCTYTSAGDGGPGGGDGGSGGSTDPGTGGENGQDATAPVASPVTLGVDGKQYTLGPGASLKTNKKTLVFSGSTQNMTGGMVWVYEVKKDKGTLLKQVPIDAAGNWTTTLKYKWKKKRYYRFAFYNAAGELASVSDVYAIQTGGKKK